MRLLRQLAMILAVVGFIAIIASSSGAVGAFLGTTREVDSTIAAGFLILILALATLLATMPTTKKTVIDATLRHSNLERLAEDACKNQAVKKEIERLIERFRECNNETGLGTPGYIKGTDIHYLRGRKGGRVFYRQTGTNTYEIIGKADKNNEDNVIGRIVELYMGLK